MPLWKDLVLATSRLAQVLGTFPRPAADRRHSPAPAAADAAAEAQAHEAVATTSAAATAAAAAAGSSGGAEGQRSDAAAGSDAPLFADSGHGPAASIAPDTDMGQDGGPVGAKLPLRDLVILLLSATFNSEDLEVQVRRLWAWLLLSGTDNGQLQPWSINPDLSMKLLSSFGWHPYLHTLCLKPSGTVMCMPFAFCQPVASHATFATSNFCKSMGTRKPYACLCPPLLTLPWIKLWPLFS